MTKKKYLVGGIALAFLFVIGLVAVKPVLATNSFWGSIVERVSDKIAAGALSDKPTGTIESDQAFGAANSVSIGATGASHFNTMALKDPNSDVTLERKFVYGTIGHSTSTFASVCNSSPGFMNLVGGGIQLMGTTSATTKFSMGTSTSSGTAPEYNASAGAIPRGILNARPSVTSTVNDYMDFTFENSNFSVNAGLNASSTKISIPQNTCVIGYMTTGASNIGYSSVTSTQAGRGFIDDSYYYLIFERVATST